MGRTGRLPKSFTLFDTFTPCTPSCGHYLVATWRQRPPLRRCFMLPAQLTFLAVAPAFFRAAAPSWWAAASLHPALAILYALQVQ